MNKAAFLMVTLLTVFFSNAQQSAISSSLLWKIEGNGLSEPSYLFGTIHLICEADFEIKEKVSSAFNSTSNLVLEVNMTDPKEIAAMQEMMNSPTTLSSRLNEKERIEANEILTKYIGITLQQAEHIAPSGLLSTSVYNALPCKPAELKFFEFELVRLAKEQHKTVAGLETIDSQMAAIDKAYTLQQLLGQIKLKDEYVKVIADMVKFYKDENIPALESKIKDRRFMDEKAEVFMLTERNRAWVKRIPAIVEKESTFFAVGAGHLYGKTGLIELLKQQGYKVTPVK